MNGFGLAWHSSGFSYSISARADSPIGYSQTQTWAGESKRQLGIKPVSPGRLLTKVRPVRRYRLTVGDDSEERSGVGALVCENRGRLLVTQGSRVLFQNVNFSIGFINRCKSCLSCSACCWEVTVCGAPLRGDTGVRRRKVRRRKRCRPDRHGYSRTVRSAAAAHREYDG